MLKCIIIPWFYQFSNERESLKGHLRKGRVITAIIQENIDNGKDLVNNNPHVSNLKYIGNNGWEQSMLNLDPQIVGRKVLRKF